MGYKIGQRVYFIDYDEIVRRGTVEKNAEYRNSDYVVIKRQGRINKDNVSTNKNNILKKLEKALEFRMKEKLGLILQAAEEIKIIDELIIKNKHEQKKNKTGRLH